jgi:hypothetical protein
MQGTHLSHLWRPTRVTEGRRWWRSSTGLLWWRDLLSVVLRLLGHPPKLPRAPLYLLDWSIAPNGGGKLKFGGYLGFGGFLTCSQKLALWTVLYIVVFYRIIVGKDSNLFLIHNWLYHAKICERIKRGKFGWALPGWTRFRLTLAGLGSPRVGSGRVTVGCWLARPALGLAGPMAGMRRWKRKWGGWLGRFGVGLGFSPR